MPGEPLIDDELAAFLQSGVSTHVASRDAANLPLLVRGVGCRVAPDRTRVTVFLRASQCGRMLADFAANGAIAFVASQPSTHRTVQLKGTDAAVEPARPADRLLVESQRAALADDLVTIGFDRSFPETLLGGEAADLVAVSFTPSAAFVQTPGPGAGAPLGTKR